MTGWYDLDHGYAVKSRSVELAPCGQTGVLALRVGPALTPPPVDQCDTESDVSTVATRRLTAGTGLQMSSLDNRAVTPANRDGALVKLTIPVGEPGSVSSVGNSQIQFTPSGFPECTADLRAQSVRCSGLVPHARYTLTRRRGHGAVRARASRRGIAAFAGFAGPVGIRGGDVIALANSSGRVLTALHVSRLQVDVKGQETALSGGTCEPGEYYGPPPTTIRTSAGIGAGIGGTGTICPATGHAAGLSTADIAEIDDRSGGQTRTEVPSIVRTTPTDGATLYGAFIAEAQAGLPGRGGSVVSDNAPVGLTITGRSSGRAVFRARNVDTAQGVVVRALAPGTYLADWVLKDAGGDTRTLRTTFVEAP